MRIFNSITYLLLGILIGVIVVALSVFGGIVKIDQTIYLTNLVDATIAILIASYVAALVSKQVNKSASQTQRYHLAVDDFALSVVGYRASKRELAYRISRDGLSVDDILSDLSELADPLWTAYEVFRNRVYSNEEVSAELISKISDKISEIDTGLSDPPSGTDLSMHIRNSQEDQISRLLNLAYGSK